MVAILAGTLPLCFSFFTQLPHHQWVSAFLLSAICIGFSLKDRWANCIAAIALTFVAHSVVAIGLARHYPEQSAFVMPRAANYWERQEKWIRTGENEEYKVASWLPGHIQLFLGVSIFSFSSFGVLIFRDGFVQVDVMNFYNARLQLESRNQTKAIGYGWHFWSICRGLGYLFIVYEMISLAVQFCIRQTLASNRKRMLRWSIGVGFLVADCVIKFFAVDAVRLKLFENLA